MAPKRRFAPGANDDDQPIGVGAGALRAEKPRRPPHRRRPRRCGIAATAASPHRAQAGVLGGGPGPRAAIISAAEEGRMAASMRPFAPPRWRRRPAGRSRRRRAGLCQARRRDGRRRSGAAGGGRRRADEPAAAPPWRRRREARRRGAGGAARASGEEAARVAPDPLAWEEALWSPWPASPGRAMTPRRRGRRPREDVAGDAHRARRRTGHRAADQTLIEGFLISSSGFSAGGCGLPPPAPSPLPEDRGAEASPANEARHKLIRHLSGHHLLLNDDEAATFFNQLGGVALFDHRVHQFARLFRDTNEYCNCRWNRYMAVFKRDHLRTPCSIIKLIVASILLCASVMSVCYIICRYHHACS
ncbi:hypothetical protein QYE76_007249 [Lolium multiflorum]|uniref:Uncharacterized protein n=1 Tax=Lolium multiflorum TaxID=4521 RepID=A0AAD8RXG0_LOLMU|nr:hypothetical protein QYE76_007249 [Lolium multiflorum]